MQERGGRLGEVRESPVLWNLRRLPDAFRIQRGSSRSKRDSDILRGEPCAGFRKRFRTEGPANRLEHGGGDANPVCTSAGNGIIQRVISFTSCTAFTCDPQRHFSHRPGNGPTVETPSPRRSHGAIILATQFHPEKSQRAGPAADAQLHRIKRCKQLSSPSPVRLVWRWSRRQFSDAYLPGN